MLAGEATSYTDPSPPAGDVSYAVTGVLAEVFSDPDSCTVVVPVAPVQELVCTSTPFQAVLTWTEPMAYDTVTVMRGSTVVAVGTVATIWR